MIFLKKRTKNFERKNQRNWWFSMESQYFKICKNL